MQCKNCRRAFKTVGGLKYHKKFCRLTLEKIVEIQRLYESGKSEHDLVKIGFNRYDVNYALTGKKKTISDILVQVHKNKPELFKWTEESKENMRKKRLKYLKEHPFDNAWRRSNISYIEKCFISLIEKHKLFEKYDIIREYREGRYYLDFAFLNIKLDVEIDGSQHFEKKRREHDEKRDQFMINRGWKTYRIAEFQIKKQFELVEKNFLSYLENFENQQKKFYYKDEIIEYYHIRLQKLEAEKLKKEEKKKQKFAEKEKKITERREKIKDIDFSKFGWVAKVGKILEISHSQAKRFMKLHCLDIFENAKKRKTNAYTI